LPGQDCGCFASGPLDGPRNCPAVANGYGSSPVGLVTDCDFQRCRSRARSRRYLESLSGCLRSSRRAFCVFFRVVGALPGQCLRRRTLDYPLVAAVFRTKRLPCERCSATCHRRRCPGQARRGQGRLQITAVVSARRAEILAVPERTVRDKWREWGPPAYRIGKPPLMPERSGVPLLSDAGGCSMIKICDIQREYGFSAYVSLPLCVRPGKPGWHG
jgi:hypothetical protein